MMAALRASSLCLLLSCASADLKHLRLSSQAMSNHAAAHSEISIHVDRRCDPPQGFECVSNTSAPYSTVPGNFDTGAVSAAETALITSMQDFVKEHKVKILYNVCAPNYVVEHMLPLLHVLPGELIAECEHGLHVALPRILADRVRPTDATLTQGGADNAHVIIAISNNWETFMVRRAEAPGFNLLQNIALSHGDDDDAFTRGTEDKKVKSRPFQDLSFSNYARKYRYEDPSVVATYLNTSMANAHKDAPCRQSGCRGTLLVATGFDFMSEFHAGCKEMLSMLSQEWLVVLRLHPLWWDKSPEFPCAKEPNVYVDDPNMGISLLDIVSRVDAVVTDSGGILAAVMRERLDMPIVRVYNEAFRSQYASVKHSVFNESMGEVIFAHDDIKAALDKRQMTISRGPWPSVVAYRQDYLCRYLWQIDGFEEYRVAYQVLVDGVPDAAFDDMKSKLEAVTHVPPRPSELLAASYPPGSVSAETEEMNHRRMENPMRDFNKHSTSSCSGTRIPPALASLQQQVLQSQSGAVQVVGGGLVTLLAAITSVQLL